MATNFIDAKGLAKRITEVRDELAKLLHLESFLGAPKAKRGRKPGSKLAKAPKAAKGKRGKRGAIGEKILKVLSAKGKEGAHVKDIATALKTKPANVTAWFYTTGKSKTKKVAPATFALKD